MRWDTVALAGILAALICFVWSSTPDKRAEPSYNTIEKIKAEGGIEYTVGKIDYGSKEPCLLIRWMEGENRPKFILHCHQK